MRWASPTDGSPTDEDVPGQLALPGAVTRTFDAPGFAGMTFYEVHAKSLINKVGGEGRVPFEHTINPYRGCGHACTYCFARNSHTYLDLDAGVDFDSKIIVKVNAVEVLRRELSSARWRGRPIAMGANVDCYQRAEGRYRLMPGILGALRDAANPFSILTKGTLILRDLPILVEASLRTQVSVAFSIGFLDEHIWHTVESGTPSPARRIDAVRRFTEAGMRVAVLMAPIMPGLTDSQEQLDQTVGALADAGAASITPLVLHLRPGAREWYLGWLGRAHPHLLPLYEQLYRGGSYATDDYQRLIAAKVRRACRRHGVAAPEQTFRDVSTPKALGTAKPAPASREPAVAREREAAQLTLL